MTTPIDLRSADRRFGLTLPGAHLEKMLRLARKAAPLETGGVLAGRYNDDLDCALVTDVSDPPSDSTARRTAFDRGITGLQSWLSKLWSSAKRSYYIGEWHFHPGGTPTPSHQDAAQMRDVARDRAYKCPEPVLLILGGDPNASWEVAAYVFTSGGTCVSLLSASENAVAAVDK